VSITMVGVTPDVDHRPAASGARHLLAQAAPSVGSEALTTQGRIVRIRAVAAGDADALRALNRRTSDDSMYLRLAPRCFVWAA
jgi:hypothetical protein